jgi:hypothetical protein
MTRTKWTLIPTLLCGGVTCAGCRRPHVATTVNPTSIRAIKIGMTEQQVKAGLGGNATMRESYFRQPNRPQDAQSLRQGQSTKP